MSALGGTAATVAVLDVGKTNVKLHAATPSGLIVESLSVPNQTVAGPPWRHHDLTNLGAWVFEGLSQLCKYHPIATFIAAAHGSAGTLIGSDPDKGDGTVLPMIDYEQDLPADVRLNYESLCGSLAERGSALMPGAAHQARQLLWMSEASPREFQRARWFVSIPQYWAWRLSGVATTEVTSLAAQSHLWNFGAQKWSSIVERFGWQRLMPPLHKAWQTIGRVRPELAKRLGLPPDIRVLTGVHDSSANFYRYQAAGMVDTAVVSTGTWIVSLSGQEPFPSLDTPPALTSTRDVYGNPLYGSLAMGGREFSLIAGPEGGSSRAQVSAVVRLIANSAMALPSFAGDNGFFPGSVGKGRILGVGMNDPVDREALAVIYVALLTVEGLDVLKANRTVVLDGSFVRDPIYASLVAAFRSEGLTYHNPDFNGVGSGAAMLTDHQSRRQAAALDLCAPGVLPLPLDQTRAYARAWRSAAYRHD